MRIRYALPEAAIRPDVLNAALETSTRANEALLESGGVRPISEAIKRGLVRWKPEAFTDGEHFDHIETVNARGWGDCDDLAPAYAGELRVRGIDEGARAIVKRTSPTRWHAVVRRSDGRIIDPSKAAGMGRKRSINGTGVQLAMVDDEDGVIGIKRHGKNWVVRCDLPIEGTPMHVCGLALGPEFDDTLTDAVEGACLIGDGSDTVDPQAIARALALNAALLEDEAAMEGLEDDVDVGFLPLAMALAPTALSMVSKMMPGKKKKRGAAPAAPAGGGRRRGGGGGRAVTARPSGGGGPVSISPYGPGGPVIVRF